jgi:hypothetical protein
VYGRGVEAPPAPASPVFVCGSSRSGTTLVARLLDRHPDVFAFTELHFLEQLAEPAEARRWLEPAAAADLLARLLANQHAFAQTTGTDAAGYRAQAVALLPRLGLVEPTPARLFAAYLRHEAAQHGAPVACEHTPRNVYVLPELLALYPDARVVVLLRDPRDVLASQKHKWRAAFLGGRFPRREQLRLRVNYHPVTTSLLWRGAVRAGDAVRDERVLQLRFEDLVAEPARHVEALCRHVGLDFDPTLLEVSVAGSSFGPGSQATGLDRAAVGRWARGALTPTEAAICDRLTATERARHGYPDAGVRPDAAALAWQLGRWPVVTAAAVALNARHYGDLPAAVRRRLSPRAPR